MNLSRLRFSPLLESTGDSRNDEPPCLSTAHCNFNLSNKHASRLIADAFQSSLNVACVVCELQDEQCGSFARQSNRATLRNIFPADFSHEIMNEIVGPMVLADIAVGSASDDLRRVSCSVRWRQEISVCTSCV